MINYKVQNGKIITDFNKISYNGDLNENELFILACCLQAAQDEGDNGHEFLFSTVFILSKFNVNVVKGYISQLNKKGYISMCSDCYFDAVIKELYDNF